MTANRSTLGFPFPSTGLCLALFGLAALLAFASPGVASAQEPDQPTATAEAPAVEAPEAAIEPAATETETEAAVAEEPPQPPAETAEAEVEAPADEAVGGEEAAESDAEQPAADEAAAEEGAAQAAAGADEEESGLDLRAVLLTLAVIIVPLLVGNWLAKQIRLPEQAWKISLILVVFSVSALAVATGRFKGGPDLAGGITLVYEIADAEPAPVGAPDEAAQEEEIEQAPQQAGKVKVDIDQMIQAIKQRVDPSGTKEVTIRRYGDAIEIIIPHAGPDDLRYIKRRITDLGQLEFRIVADPRWDEDKPIVEKALALGPSQKTVVVNERDVAEWVLYSEEEFPEGDDRLVRREAGSRKEALVLLDKYDVTGEYLANASKDADEFGKPAVAFIFKPQGARRFGRLTGDNLPNQATGAYRNLGIVLDKEILSAPRIKSRITDRGTISGGAMDDKEVEHIISILDAGSLPAALNKTPISEETISPTLGATTIEKGKWAIGVSLAAVLVFILIYYRFAGIVACMALAGTMLLVLAAMVIFQAAFTLPGLAGLVLTVGMAVDANVLIYERIREELKRGAGLRMAIRNGFDRATTTIVDANLTTLITAVVLYAIGTDQIRGFAVTLFLGIVMSMFTSIFCSRVVFDIVERKRWLKSLSFFQLVGDTKIDFIGKRYVAAAASLAVIAIGLFGVYERGSGMLNIDFTGGTSVTVALTEENKMDIGEMRSLLEGTEFADKNLLVVERGQLEQEASNTRYTVNSSVDDVGKAEAMLAEALAGKLQSYKLDVGEPAAFEESGFSGTDVPLTFNEGPGFGEGDGLAHDALLERLQRIGEEQGHKGALPQLLNDDYRPGSSQRFKNWTLRMGLGQDETVAIAQALKTELESEPIFPLANMIGGKVAGDLQSKAMSAILVSLLGIVGYLWFRFQNVSYGLAAVVALVHDVLVTLGAIALSAWVVSAAPSLATALQIDAFQISLPIVAAFITIIGYSLNDTIVVFDRIREVRGKSPKVTAPMINTSVNQTLGRTLLTSLTTLIVVVILYFGGGAGIHAFAFSLVVGVVVGTYSSIFVASPALLAMSGEDETPAAKE